MRHTTGGLVSGDQPLKKQSEAKAEVLSLRAQELCESRGGRPGLPVPNNPYGLCGRKATLNEGSRPERGLYSSSSWSTHNEVN